MTWLQVGLKNQANLVYPQDHSEPGPKNSIFFLKTKSIRLSTVQTPIIPTWSQSDFAPQKLYLIIVSLKSDLIQPIFPGTDALLS